MRNYAHFVQRVVKRANRLPYLLELSYACDRLPGSYSLFSSHCRKSGIQRALPPKPRRMR
jgi:hypothetical protein